MSRLSVRQARWFRGNLFRWLERRTASPEFAGGMLLGLSAFFFMAATNTLAGWLYVISGVGFALLAIGAVMPGRVLQEIHIERSRLEPVSAGDILEVTLQVTNNNRRQQAVLQVRDMLPPGLTDRPQAPEIVIDRLMPRTDFRWHYAVTTAQRGIFALDEVQLVTAGPLGLFRSRRSRFASQRAIVYPQVLSLKQCPLIDRLGKEESPRQTSMDRAFNAANEGVTKTLRPYHWGDPIRLVHWRTSARFGELRVRELELTVGGQDIVVALDTVDGWRELDFEQAAVAAASLYFYAQRLNLNVRLWTPADGLRQGSRPVLETLAAATVTAESETASDLPDLPTVWITHRRQSLNSLPAGSRWLYWGDVSGSVASAYPGLTIAVPHEEALDSQYRALQSQLQASL